MGCQSYNHHQKTGELHLITVGRILPTASKLMRNMAFESGFEYECRHQLNVTLLLGGGFGMALFRDVAELAERLAGEAGRLKKRAAIAEAIAAVHAAAPESEDAGLFAMYLAGTPFAEADARKLNAGGALLSKALLAVSGASDVELTAAYRRHGDMGAAGFDLLMASSAAARQSRMS